MDLSSEAVASPPADLIGRHTYAVALCNPEGADNVFVTDHGASPHDGADDTAAIQAAIDAAASSEAKMVFRRPQPPPPSKKRA